MSSLKKNHRNRKWMSGNPGLGRGWAGGEQWEGLAQGGE